MKKLLCLLLLTSCIESKGSFENNVIIIGIDTKYYLEEENNKDIWGYQLESVFGRTVLLDSARKYQIGDTLIITKK